MGLLYRPLVGILLLSTCLVARDIMQYPPSYNFKPYDGDIAQAKAMSPDCPREGYVQCPTPNFSRSTAHWPCVKYDELCDGHPNCPQGEDEHPSMCMYHKMLDREMDRIRKVIVNAHRSP